MKRTELPSELFKDHFIVMLPDLQEEEEEGLVEEREEDKTVIVAQVGSECSLIKVGDDLLLGQHTQVVASFTIDHESGTKDYVMMRERDVIGKW
jgi:hypothetical protein